MVLRNYDGSREVKMIFNGVNVLLVPMVSSSDGMPYTFVLEFNKETGKHDIPASPKTIRKLNKDGPPKGRPYSRFDIDKNIEDRNLRF